MTFLDVCYEFFLILVDNEAHCDFVKLREMLIRTNMEDMREKTHTRHYELYRQKRLEQMGFTDVDSDNKPVSNLPDFTVFVLILTKVFFCAFRFHSNKHSRPNDQIIWPNYKEKKTR